MSNWYKLKSFSSEILNLHKTKIGCTRLKFKNYYVIVSLFLRKVYYSIFLINPGVKNFIIYLQYIVEKNLNDIIII